MGRGGMRQGDRAHVGFVESVANKSDSAHACYFIVVLVVLDEDGEVVDVLELHKLKRDLTEVLRSCQCERLRRSDRLDVVETHVLSVHKELHCCRRC